MKELAGSAATSLEASPEACLELVAAIDQYPRWYPETIREVEVLERDESGRPAQARARVHAALGPLARDFELVMKVTHDEGRAVTLTRVPNEPTDPERFDVAWRVAAGPPTQLEIKLTASLDVPRLVPVGGAGDRLAQGFVEAATRELDGSSPNASASSS